MSHQTTDMSSQLNHPKRGLALQSIENARDLGGYQTVDGGHTRFGVFVRTADMDLVVEADRVSMRDHGISLVIDLRMQREREEKPNLFSRGSLGDPAFRVHDFWGDRFDTYRSPDRSAPPAKKLADLYCAGLQASDFVMAEIIRSLASAEGAACGVDDVWQERLLLYERRVATTLATLATGSWSMPGARPTPEGVAQEPVGGCALGYPVCVGDRI